MLSHILNIGKHVLAETDVNQVLTIAIDDAIKITKAERGMILLFNDNEEIIFQTARNLENEEIKNPEFEISRTIIKKSQKYKETIFLENALTIPEFKESQSASRLKIQSVICLPLQKENKVFGVVYLDNRTIQGVFTKESYQFVESFSDFISLAAYNALQQKRLLNRVTTLEKQLRSKFKFEEIIGHHPKMCKILKLVSQIANIDTTILIQGESGTGKELIAKAIHYNSARQNYPFIPINCGSIPESLLESELFGYIKGAFTGANQNKLGWFERAHKGSILLDEISEMSPNLQVKLLRVIESGEYFKVGNPEILNSDVRIIAATNKSLKKLVESRSFREDLFYRLNVVKIELPPLRERQSDIIPLAFHFVKVFTEKFGRGEKRLSKNVQTTLLSYHYPGNVRELQNIIHHAVAISENELIKPIDLPEYIFSKEENQFEKNDTHSLIEIKRLAADKAEYEFVISCLKKTQGHISKAAKIAQIHVSNFHKIITKHKIDPKSFSIY